MFAVFNLPVKIAFFLPAIVLGWTLLIGGPVTEMPFGLEEPLQLVADILATIISTLPWMEPVIWVFMMGLQVKLMFIAVNIIQWLTNIFAT